MSIPHPHPNTYLKLVIVGKDQSGVHHWSMSELPTNAFISLTYIANTKRESLASIGNRHLDLLDHNPQHILGLVHADCSFGPGALETFASCAIAGNVCGVVGITLDQHYTWGKDLARDSQPAPVSTLDSCSVFFRADLPLRFDERLFNSFHCHVEDLCLQAQTQGIPVVVPATDSNHIGLTGADIDWQAQYRIYKHRLMGKWQHVRFQTT